MNKYELRKKYLELRSSMKKEDVQAKSKMIINKIKNMDIYKKSQMIMTYIDFRNEVVTKNLIIDALQEGKRIVIPVCDMKSKTLMVSEIKNFYTELHYGSYGILEPKKESMRNVDYKKLDLILVPGVLFDLKGYRIGYGGGYYDRFFNYVEHNAKIIGLAFDYQVLDQIPIEEFDQKVNIIVTEERIIINDY